LGKLKIFSGKQVCKILADNGFLKLRQKGSHIVMQKKYGDTTITVPVPNHPELKIGTLQSIIRQSQIPRVMFEI
jgi:predicted RNA binding protein YcfA (HicA-like mRNA interferase family)